MNGKEVKVEIKMETHKVGKKLKWKYIGWARDSSGNTKGGEEIKEEIHRVGEKLKRKYIRWERH